MRRWPKGWQSSAHQDRLDEQGNRVFSVILKDESGVEVEARAGDMVGFRKEKQKIGVIDRITPARVRVLSQNKYGNYVESSLIFHKRMERPRETGRGDETPSCTHTDRNHEAPPSSSRRAGRTESSRNTQVQQNAEVLTFFRTLEEKMVAYTSAAVELFLMMEAAKVRFTAGAGSYPDHIEEIRDEFRAEALRRVSEFQRFIEQMDDKFRVTGER